MPISYAICVCNEHREFADLIHFLQIVKRSIDEIVVLVDSRHSDPPVLKEYDDIVVVRREFDNDFAAHKNFLGTCCSKDYIFNIDADEMPTEKLIRLLETVQNLEVLAIPRINIIPGCTDKWLEEQKFVANNLGWINWPDFQTRFYKRTMKWEGRVHEKIISQHMIALHADPSIAMWHIKSVKRQTSQNKYYDTLATPTLHPKDA